MYGLGQRKVVAAQMEEEMGVKVNHKCGKLLHIHTEVNGKSGKEELLPAYYNAMCFAPCCKGPCKGALDKTVKYAKEIEGGGPNNTEMGR